MDPKTWRVLVVEDEYDSIQMVSKILRHHGAEVHVAHDGHECIQMLPTVRPNLIIMDLALPEMDGWETLTKIRQDQALAGVPVVAITAYHSVSVEQDARAHGFDAYFPKPLDTNAIISQLARVLGQSD